MTDALGWRHCFGVLGPSTNVVMQPDLELMRPVGVTNHDGHILTPDSGAVGDETFMTGARLIGENTLDAVRAVMTARPDPPVMGMLAWLGRPVIAINAATCWHALRGAGLTDRTGGLGRLLEDQ